MTKKLLFIVFLLSLAASSQAARTLDKSIGWPGTTFSGLECYGKNQGFGPFDYNDPETYRQGGYSWLTGGDFANPRVMVEGAHFTQHVEQLIRGKSAKSPEPDIDYTLRAFPNHHRALWAMSRWYLRQLSEQGIDKLNDLERAQRGFAPPECYFQRAVAFAPEDKMVSAVFGIYLHRRGMLDQALQEYQKAEKGNPDHAELMYNIGLLHLDRGDLEAAKQYADKARALKYPLTGLYRRIQRMERDAKAAPSSKNAN